MSQKYLFSLHYLDSYLCFQIKSFPRGFGTGVCSSFVVPCPWGSDSWRGPLEAARCTHFISGQGVCPLRWPGVWTVLQVLQMTGPISHAPSLLGNTSFIQLCQMGHQGWLAWSPLGLDSWKQTRPSNWNWISVEWRTSLTSPVRVPFLFTWPSTCVETTLSPVIAHLKLKFNLFIPLLKPLLRHSIVLRGEIQNVVCRGRVWGNGEDGLWFLKFLTVPLQTFLPTFMHLTSFSLQHSPMNRLKTYILNQNKSTPNKALSESNFSLWRAFQPL